MNRGLLIGVTGLALALSTRAAGDDEPAAPRIPTPELRIDGGVIRGLVVGDKKDVHVYKGIPYAAPPVGDRRWKPPQPVAAWQGVRDCFEFGAACPQQGPPSFLVMPELVMRAPFSEDCLYLNVWVPAVRDPATPLPVLYWVHGGAFVMGAASQPLYDGEELARLGCVVVSVNYRLGLFGFLAHPALSREDPQRVSGNYGLLDQVEGLRWVRRNIAAFGGDPDRVALCGESAGGASVLCLMVAPEAAGLFRGAVAQSAPWMEMLRLRDAGPDGESAEQVGERMIAACGLDGAVDATRLRGLDTQALVRSAPTGLSRGGRLWLRPRPFSVGPIVDGRLIPDQPNRLFEAGREHAVPMIVGNTRDETTMFFLGVPLPADGAAYAKALEHEFGDQAAAIAAAYPARESSQVRSAILQLTGDLTFVGESRFVARAHAASGRDTFRYQFSRGSARGLLAVLGAHHGAELPYLFQRPVGRPDKGATRISRSLGQYWINFAATGKPGSLGLQHWPAYRAPDNEMVDFANEVYVIQSQRNDQLDLIEKVHRGAAPKAAPGGAGRPTRKAPAGLAARVWDITEAVLEHHIEPPTRQAMIASGLASLLPDVAVRLQLPGFAPGLPAITSREQLGALLDETWDQLPAVAKPGEPLTRDDTLIYGMFRAIPGGARFVSRSELKVQKQIEGNAYVGIHVAVGYDQARKQVTIATVLKGGPADQNGVRTGDLIEEIDGVSAVGMKMEDVLDRIRGREGTVVAIRFRQAGSSETTLKRITRGLLPRRTLAGIRDYEDGRIDVLVRGEGRIAYLKLLEIAGSTPHELRKMARRIRADGARALVLDLRRVDRADPHFAMFLADFLLDAGTIGRLRTRQGVETYRATPDTLFPDLPLAVLVDGQTSGPAEWLAAALQDNHRAVIVGRPPGSEPRRRDVGPGPGADVRTAVPIGDGTELLELATGRLERGDGRPLSTPSPPPDIVRARDATRPGGFDLPAPGVASSPPARQARAERPPAGPGLTPDIVAGQPSGSQTVEDVPREQDPNVSGDAILTAALIALRKQMKE